MREVKNTENKKGFAERLDSLIGIFAPAWELRRRLARHANEFAVKKFGLRGGYAGASKDRLRSSWLPGGGSADEDLLPDLPDLRERSRDLVRNDGTAAGIVTTMTSNVVGTGIIPQSNVDMESLGIDETTAEDFQRKAERCWERWVPHADAGNRMSFWEIQNLIESQILQNGEVIIIPEMIDEPGRPYFRALNIIESDRLETPSDLRSNKNIRSGVEIGARGEPVAYWIRKTHPGDITYTEKRMSTSENFIRYEAKNKYGQWNVWHRYWIKRPGQTRGVPFFAPVINKFKDLAEYMEAELVAQRVAACFSLFIKKTNPYDAAIGRADSTSGTKRLEEMEPGMVEYLAPGEDITSFNPQRPGAQFDPFIEKVLRFIGTGLALPYELVFKDFSKTNYSSARAAILEARKFFKQEQVWLSEKICQPTWEMLMDEAYLRGDIEAKDYFKQREHWTRARWIAPGWGYIDPEKEINASITAIENNISSLADECASHGRDYEDIMKQRAKEEKLRKELGLEKAQPKAKVPVGAGAPAKEEVIPGAPNKEVPNEEN